jgi:bacillithiol synthase
MKILSSPPTDSTLVRDWLNGTAAAAPFYPGPPGSPATYGPRLDSLKSRISRDHREQVAGVIRGGGPEAAGRLQAFVENDGVMVTTGQQPVLLGGPLYVLYKALTAIALAEHLEARLDQPVLPVFWIASEDHDWEEARQIALLDLENELHQVALAERGPPSPPLHRIRPGEELLGALQKLLAILPETDFSPPLTRQLEAACTESETLPELAERVLLDLLGGLGLFTVQSHAPPLKASTRDLLLRELERSEASEAELRAGGEALRQAGYELQVPILDGATNLFLEGPAGRERLLRDGEGFRLRRSGEIRSLDEIRQTVDADPGVLSPNVLLRPVAESAFLPTVAYVAGPGEAAYLAQTGALFQAHGLERPVVVPRVSLHLVEGKVEKVMGKYGLELEALSRPHHELAGELVREELPGDLRSALGAFRGAVAQHASRLAAAMQEVDPTLKGPVDHVRNQAFAGLHDVERKAVQALKRENEIGLAQLAKAQMNLFPEGRPQERVLSFWQYLFRYGPDLLDELLNEARVRTALDEAAG